MKFLPFTVFLVSLNAAVAAAEDSATIDFSRQIRPILSENCFACHGPDANTVEADLRLDVRERALSGIVPGDPDASVVIARIESEDADTIMPPPSSHKTLTAEQKQLLRQWVAEGAKYDQHWAYRPLKTPEPPMVSDATWPNNPIDAFVLRRIESEGLKPSKPADRVTLIRRLSFDLTGLPPTPQEVAEFVADDSDHAVEQLVDRLLESPHFGERMAIYWLDLVRFADTDGYHGDNPRQVSPYRDYVIRSFNENKPYNRFLVEQLAGDLLPDVTRETKIASSFNRLLQTTTEGGAQAKEYLAKYRADRVRNTSAAILGSTMGCAECHDHKYDPFSMRDFYSFAAFFADIDEEGVERPKHTPLPTPEQQSQLDAIDERIAKKERELSEPGPRLEGEMATWIEETTAAVADKLPELGTWHRIGPFRAKTHPAAHKKDFGPEKGVDLARVYQEEDGNELRWTEQPEWKDGQSIPLSGADSANYAYRVIKSDRERTIGLSLGSDDSIKVWINGRLVHDVFAERPLTPDQEQVAIPLQPGENHLLIKICNGGGGYEFACRPIRAPLPLDVLAIFETAPNQQTDEQRKRLAEHFRSQAPSLQVLRDEIAALKKEREATMKEVPEVLITRTRSEPRMVRILPRGNWQDDSGDVVAPAIPAFLGSLEITDRRPNRLDLAYWVASDENPLTARVWVNRVWMLMFGRGLSASVDDFGGQGTAPTHPELLDYLASDFVRHGWDTKRLIRQMVLSATYQQSSTADRQLRERDPYNELLARQGHWRLDAEMVRDNALQLSGLLVDDVGGRSVFPYQPQGYWMHLKFPNRTYQHDTGKQQYRRGVYTWWQRTFLHPTMLAFDAPTREECTARRPRSNTPLQALALLNDPSFVEAARNLGQRVIQEGGPTDQQRITWLMRLATSREPSPRELELLLELKQQQLEFYRMDETAAANLLGVGLSPRDDSLDAAELAAWTQVTRAVLNLHEVITRY